jgi:hypothetical protein
MAHILNGREGAAGVVGRYHPRFRLGINVMFNVIESKSSRCSIRMFIITPFCPSFSIVGIN